MLQVYYAQTRADFVSVQVGGLGTSSRDETVGDYK
jgi:hypothetical protein